MRHPRPWVKHGVVLLALDANALPHPRRPSEARPASPLDPATGCLLQGTLDGGGGVESLTDPLIPTVMGWVEL